MLNPSIKNTLLKGVVIPAHPLVLHENRKLDEERQRRLTRYYMDSGAGGIAVGVHTTQFEIRKSGIDLLETVLRLASEEVGKGNLKKPFIKVAGIVGQLKNALHEAELAQKYQYDLGLVSLGALKNYSDHELIKHVEKIAEIVPVFGFYLQPAVGGRYLSYEFWRDFADIPNVHAIKVAAFNRYQTLDVVRAVCHSQRCDDIALYTGNDDNIVADLLTPYHFNVNGIVVEKRFAGGLLGHWAVWTSCAVKLLDEIHHAGSDKKSIETLLTKGVEITDMNAAIFDAGNNFHGCIPGIHEVLKRQGLLEDTWSLDPHEKLSPGQLEEIDRVCKTYPGNTDDNFVKEFLEKDKR